MVMSMLKPATGAYW